VPVRPSNPLLATISYFQNSGRIRETLIAVKRSDSNPWRPCRAEVQWSESSVTELAGRKIRTVETIWAYRAGESQKDPENETWRPSNTKPSISKISHPTVIARSAFRPRGLKRGGERLANGFPRTWVPTAAERNLRR
jgi:hypothetical protein